MNGHSSLKCSFFPHIQHVSELPSGGLLIGENFLILFTRVDTRPAFAILTFLMVALDLKAFHYSSLGCLLGTPPATSLVAANNTSTSSSVYVASDFMGTIVILGSKRLCSLLLTGKPLTTSNQLVLLSFGFLSLTLLFYSRVFPLPNQFQPKSIVKVVSGWRSIIQPPTLLLGDGRSKMSKESVVTELLLFLLLFLSPFFFFFLLFRKFHRRLTNLVGNCLLCRTAVWSLWTNSRQLRKLLVKHSLNRLFAYIHY